MTAWLIRRDTRWNGHDGWSDTPAHQTRQLFLTHTWTNTLSPDWIQLSNALLSIPCPSGPGNQHCICVCCRFWQWSSASQHGSMFSVLKRNWLCLCPPYLAGAILHGLSHVILVGTILSIATTAWSGFDTFLTAAVRKHPEPLLMVPSICRYHYGWFSFVRFKHWVYKNEMWVNILQHW